MPFYAVLGAVLFLALLAAPASASLYSQIRTDGASGNLLIDPITDKDVVIEGTVFRTLVAEVTQLRAELNAQAQAFTDYRSQHMCSLQASSVQLPSFVSFGYHGGAEAGGKIYMSPRHESSVAVLDCSKNSIDASKMTGLGSSQNKWSGFVAANGLLFGIPFSATTVLVVNPSTDTADATSIIVPSGSLKWLGGVYAEGKIYGIPASAQSVLILDPTTNGTDTTTLASLPAGSNKWNGGAYVPGLQKIFGAPYDADSVLIIDLATNTTDTTSLTGFTTTSAKFSGLVYSSAQNLLFGIPQEAEYVLVLNPVTLTYDGVTMAGLGSGPKWAGGVLARDSKIYCIPSITSAVLIIDPALNTTDLTSIPDVSPARCSGAVLCLGRVYGVPFDDAKIPIVQKSCEWNAGLGAPQF